MLDENWLKAVSNEHENFILSQARTTSNFINLQIVQLPILLAVYNSTRLAVVWITTKKFAVCTLHVW